MMRRREKVVSLEEAMREIRSGMTIAIGGMWFHNTPMVFVREIIRRNIKDLTLITSPAASIQADILIGVDAVKTIISSYVGFDYLGIAPCFRRKAQEGAIGIKEVSEAFIMYGLEAGSANLPFYPLPGHEATDLIKVNPDYKKVVNPFTGEEVIVIPPLKPDVAILHVQQADVYGNCRHIGSSFADVKMAYAAECTIVTCDEIIPSNLTMREPKMTSIPGFLVKYVVHAPYGAHPGSSQGLYIHDEEHLLEYLEAARDPKTFDKYLEKYVYGPKDHFEYLERIGGIKKLMKLRTAVSE